MDSVVNDNLVEESEGSDELDNNSLSEEGLEDNQDMVTNSNKRKKSEKQTSGSKSRNKENASRKKTSWVWDHCEKISESKVTCKYCHKHLAHRLENGTNGIKNHLHRCKIFPANLDRKRKLIDYESKTITDEDGSKKIVQVPKLWQFNQENCRKALARMIIVDELPFMFVEREGFHFFCKQMCPEFIPPSRSTITRDCYSLYIEERNKLKDIFSNLNSKVCLTTDCWTSGQNLGYMCLMAHFIDDNWTLHKKIINFCPIPGHSGEIIGKSIEKCLVGWNIRKLLTITFDNASANDMEIQYLKRRINHWGGSVLDGKYLHMRCAAHIMNLIVKDGLRDLHLSIARVRSAVRWNSTFLMLEAAVKFKKAFNNLYTKGGAYCKELRRQQGVPDENDWKHVEAFLPFLHIFYEATLKMSASLHVTGNTYIPQIYGVGDLIFNYCNHEIESISRMARQMKAKYNKYWASVDNLNILLFIALLLDPRHKWSFVEWIVCDSYDEENANVLCSTIKVTIKTLYESYNNVMPHSKKKKREARSTTMSPMSDTTTRHGVNEERKIDVQDIYYSRYVKAKGTSGTSEKKSELDKYLSDDLEPNEPNFDILGWWSESQKRYPILAQIARNVLAIPVSTVASESAFSTGGRVLDSFRTSLTPKMVEALICSQDWLRGSQGPIIIEENLLKLEELEEGMKDLTIQQPTIMVDESCSISEEVM